jgi:hypothetical protein
VEDEVEDETEVNVDMSGDIADVNFGEEETEEDMGDEGIEDEEGDDNTKKIQKYTGKIGQMLRDMDVADSDLEKYVINSIISAMHLDEMDEGDKEDIIAKLEGGEDEEVSDDFDMEGGDEEVDDFDMESTEKTPEEGGEELSEDDDKMTKKEVLNITEKQMDMLHKKGICECDDKCLVYRESGVKDSILLDKIAETDKECIFISKKQMDMLHEKGICECGDVTLKYKKGKKEKNEGIVFSKKQLMESFLRRETKKTLRNVIKERRELCEQCGSRMNEGMCMKCELNESEMVYEKLAGKQRNLDKNNNGRIDAEDFKMLRKGRKDSRRNIDEEDMSVMDAIATGQGYLSATGDLDRDFDGIPNRLDMDNNNDGKLDFEMGAGDDFIDLDIDFLRNNNPGTKERERTTTRPTTRPEKGDKWRTTKRPKVDPRPKAQMDNGEDFIELDIDFLRNNNPGTKEKERTITTPTTRPGKGDKWRTIKRPKVDPRPKAEENPNMDKPKPSYRRRGMFR